MMTLDDKIAESYHNLELLVNEKREILNQIDDLIENSKYDFEVYWRNFWNFGWYYLIEGYWYLDNFDAREAREIELLWEAKRLQSACKRVQFHIENLDYDIESLEIAREYDTTEAEREEREAHALDALYDIQDSLMMAS